MLINSQTICCKRCGSHDLRHRNYQKRILKGPGGTVSWVTIDELQCHDCKSYVRNLPPNIIPFKHYERDIIDGVIDGTLTSSDLYCEDYPTEQTMRKWISLHDRGLL